MDDFLLKACKEDNAEDVALWLGKHASPTVEKDGWNPLLWASNNGNEEIVRILIKHNACAPYLNAAQDTDGSPDKAGQGVPGEEVYKVVWILLKQNMSPLDIDMHGNTAVH